MNTGLPLLPEKFVQKSLQRPSKFFLHEIQSNPLMKNNWHYFDSDDMTFDSPKTQLRALKKMNEDETKSLMP